MSESETQNKIGEYGYRYGQNRVRLGQVFKLMPALLAFAGIPRVPATIFCWKSEQGEWASNFHKRLGTGTALPLNSGHLTEAD